VYDLFTNTKSDIGPNPNVVDDTAREEFQRLPKHEQDRMGFHYQLFRKLQDLVRLCDRTVARNKDKLKAELARNKSSTDPAAEFSEEAVMKVANLMAQATIVEEDMEKLMKQLGDMDLKEKGMIKALTPPQNDASKVKLEDGTEASDADPSKPPNNADQPPLDLPVSPELSKLRLEKQHLLQQVRAKLQQLAPLHEAVEHQTKQVYFVKTDISADKTVCEISGNFMSSRDADERIAAHYAGKQYVGWKLVRDKLKEMQRDYGRMGPAAPPRGGPPPGGRHEMPRAPVNAGPPRGRGPPPPMRERSRDSRGGRRRSESPPHWERGYHGRGPPPPRGYYNNDSRGGGEMWRRDRAPPPRSDNSSRGRRR